MLSSIILEGGRQTCRDVRALHPLGHFCQYTTLAQSLGLRHGSETPFKAPAVTMQAIMPVVVPGGPAVPAMCVT